MSACANRRRLALRLARAASPFHAWNAEPQVDRRKKCAAFRALSRRGTSRATYADHAANTRRETTRPSKQTRERA